MRIIVFLFLLVTTALGQNTADTVEISKFSLGLVTSERPINLPLGAGVKVHNVDLSEGVLSVRPGYDSVFTLPGLRFKGLYAAYYSWGVQQLIAVCDSPTVGYGVIMRSIMGRHDFGDIYDSLLIKADTADILNYPMWNNAKYPIPIFGIYWNDTILYRDSTWIFTFEIERSDSANVVSRAWWADTMVALINGSSCSLYVTATDVDSGYLLVEDSSYLDILLHFVYDSIYQYSVTAPDDSLRIWSYYSTQSPPSFATFDDNVYIVNGDQRGVVWNGEIAMAYPLPAPGEPLIMPLTLVSGDNTDYSMDGEVRYAISVALDTAAGAGATYSDSLFGVITSPVKTKNGRFMLRKFSYPAADSVVDHMIPDATDTLTYYLWRTLTNPGRLTRTTKMYSTGIQLEMRKDSIFVSDQESATIDTFTSLATVFVIDSLPDSVLTNRDTTRLAISDVMAGRDSVGVIERRLGAPTYLAGDTTVVDSSLFSGSPVQRDTLGVAYAVAFIDTLNANQGPIGAPCYIWNKELDNGDTSNAKFDSITIGLPPLPAGDSGIVYNVYRAQIYQVGIYTPAHVDTIGTTGWFNILKWVDATYAVDSVVLMPFRLLGQVPGTDTLYVDTMRHDSVYLRRMYNQDEPPARIANIFAYDNRMFGYEKSFLYNSDVDSVNKWGIWSITPVGRNDGDQITAVWPGRTALRVFKNFSSYNVYDDYGKPEIVSRWGCIAPKSHVAGTMQYYLSTRGIEAESDGQYLERTIDGSLLSASLNNFDDMSIATKSSMVGMYLPTDQIALFSLSGNVDTTWAFFEETGAWSTWDLTFAGGTLYDTEDELNFTPGKTFYFFKEDDSVLYTFGTANTDNGDSITMTWRSGVIGADRYMRNLNDVGLWVSGNSVVDSLVTVYIYNEHGTKSDSLIFPALNGERYILKEYGGDQPFQYFQLEIQHTGGSADTKIDRIDFSVNLITEATEAR